MSFKVGDRVEIKFGYGWDGPGTVTDSCYEWIIVKPDHKEIVGRFSAAELSLIKPEPVQGTKIGDRVQVNFAENNEKRIYIVVAGTVQSPTRSIVQPPGRQIAQACHAVSKLRHAMLTRIHDETVVEEFEPITTIILHARDSWEIEHVYGLLHEAKLHPVFFHDSNPEYGGIELCTAISVLATKHEITGILDYLPLWKG